MSDLSLVQAACNDVDALRDVLKTLRLARQSYGVSLHGQHPQDAWTARNVDAKLAEAAGALERVIHAAPFTEAITWIPSAVDLPATDETVLICLNVVEGHPNSVGEGWFEDGVWRGSDGWPIQDDSTVGWWARKPKGPKQAGVPR